MSSSTVELAETQTHSIRDQVAGNHATVDLAWLSSKIPYRLYQECVHCGLCTASCPTYVETCNENDSPRGRIYLMRAVADGRLTLGPERSPAPRALPRLPGLRVGLSVGRAVRPHHRAVQDRHSEDARPAARAASLLQRLILHHLFPYSGRVKAGARPGPAASKSWGCSTWPRRVGLTRLLPPTLAADAGDAADAERLLEPGCPRCCRRSVPKRAQVALFLGCVADAMFPETNAATARVLQQNGCEVSSRAARFAAARSIITRESRNLLSNWLAEYRAFDPRQLRCDHRQRGRLRGHAQGLCPYPARRPSTTRPSGSWPRSRISPSSWSPSDRSRRRIRSAEGDVPRRLPPLPRPADSHPASALLAMIPGLELVPLDETEICCGAAGTYNLTQPEMSERLGRRKMDFIEATGAKIVATGNVGCILQIARKIKERGDKIEVVHPIDLLDRAYRGK